MCFIFCIIFDTVHQTFMAHVVWKSENMKKKYLLFQRPKLSKNMWFDADADIYMTKK